MKWKLCLTVTFFAFTIIYLLPSCKSMGNAQAGNNKLPDFYMVGHRGTRGLMPENTIEAMVRGIQEGANTIELDVHITKDGQVVVYHDASFNPDYTTMPDGSDIPADKRKQYTFYQMNYAEIKPFIIGKKAYPAYPRQQRIASYAPLLSALIDAVEAYTKAAGLPGVYYLVEIKSAEKTDGVEQPVPEAYIKTLMPVLLDKRLGNRLFLQSFDMRPLQVLHREYPKIRLGFLTGDKNVSFEDNLNKLGFTPFFYNPSFNLVTPTLIQQCHVRKIKMAPWTVNTLEDMKRLKAMGVDGIITDYPDLFKQL